MWAALAAGGRAAMARGAGATAARESLGKAAASRSASLRAGAAAAKPMGQGPLPPPKPTAYNYSTRTGVLPAGQRPATQRVQAMAQQAMPQPTRSQQMMQAASQSRSTTTRRGGQGQRYWQGSGTEVVGGMPANYDRMSIAGPRTMGMPSFARSWTGEALTNRIQSGIGTAIDTAAERQAATGRGSIVPASGRVASMPPRQGPLQPPVTPGRGMLPAPMSPLYQPGALRQPSGIKGGPLYRGGSDTPVSQGVRFMQPSGSSERGAQGDRNGMFGSGVLWGEQTSNTIEGGNAWNANMPGSTLPGADDAANARIARERKAGGNPVKMYAATLDWPEQK